MNFHFEILKTTPIKGKKLEGAKDYETRVKVIKDDNSVLFDEVVLVRKNKAGIFPDTDPLKKIKSETVRKDLLNNIKEHFKKIK